MGQRSKYAAVKDAQIKLKNKKEECSSDMGQRSNYAAVTGAQINSTVLNNCVARMIFSADADSARKYDWCAMFQFQMHFEPKCISTQEVGKKGNLVYESRPVCCLQNAFGTVPHAFGFEMHLGHLTCTQLIARYVERYSRVGTPPRQLAPTTTAMGGKW